MTTRETITRLVLLQKFLGSLDRSIREVIVEISRWDQRISDESIAKDLSRILLADEGSDVAPVIFELQNKYYRKRPDHRGIRPGKVFSQIYKVEEELTSIWTEDGMAGPAPRKLRTGLREFETGFEHYLRAPTAAGALHLFQVARDLSLAIEVTEDVIKSVIRTLTATSTLPDGQTLLEIFLVSPVTMAQVRGKLAALEKLYSISAELFGVSESEYPLRVLQMEVGSLWVKLFGETKTIAFITHLIESTIAYGHRNWTSEGKIGALPRKIAAVEAILDLSKRLEDAGIDTSEMRDQIQRASVTIADNLNDLLAGEKGVEINGKVLVNDSTPPLIGGTRETRLLRPGPESLAEEDQAGNVD